MPMFKKIKDALARFIATPFGRHVYSFIKTYITVFLSIYLTLHGVANDLDLTVLPDLNITDIDIIIISAKGGFLAVLRNIWKLLTE